MKKTPFQVYLDPDLYASLRKAAEEEDMSTAAFARKAFKVALDKRAKGKR